MSLSLDLLRSFLAVHRAGSVTAAADVLGLAQPTVTAQLKALEAALGRQLFERLPRGVAATPAGDELARRIAPPLDALDELVAAERPAAYPATVHLGGPAELVCERVLPALAELVAGGLQLRVTTGLPDDLLDGIAAGRLDVAVSSTRPRRRGLLVDPFFDEEFALVAAPRWADAVHGPVTPDTLRDVPLVAYGEDAPILRRYWRTVFGTRLTRTPDLVIADLRGVLASVRAGAGISVLPTYLCAEPLATRELVALGDPGVPPLNTLYLARRPQVMGRPEVAAVLARLVEAGRVW
ncbi:MAG TPA: LysR family transcriptional regulator [Jiangellaceae bacterium]